MLESELRRLAQEALGALRVAVPDEFPTAIDREFFEVGPDAVLRFDGISLAQRVEERPRGEDCYGYVFGDESFDDAISRLRATGRRTGIEPGAIAFYFDNKGLLAHVGRVTDSGMVISKWGKDGHVYEHKPELVLSLYGKVRGCYQEQ